MMNLKAFFEHGLKTWVLLHFKPHLCVIFFMIQTIVLANVNEVHCEHFVSAHLFMASY